MGGALLYNTYFTAFSKHAYADKAQGNFGILLFWGIDFAGVLCYACFLKETLERRLGRWSFA